MNYDKLRTWFEHYEACFICRQSESASAPACGTGGGDVLRHHALVAVENLAWMRDDNDPIDPRTASTTEKVFLMLPSETKLDIEFVLWGLDKQLVDDRIRRALRTIAVLAHSHGIEEGLAKMANKIDETMRAMRNSRRNEAEEAGLIPPKT